MKKGMFLLGALIVICVVAFGSGREPHPAAANGTQDCRFAAIALNMPAPTRSAGMLRIPSPAATLLEISLWARDRWRRLWVEPLDRQDCVLSDDSP